MLSLYTGLYVLTLLCARCHLFLQIYWFYCNTLPLLAGRCHSNSGLTYRYSNISGAIIFVCYTCYSVHSCTFACTLRCMLACTLHIHLAHFVTCVFLPAREWASFSFKCMHAWIKLTVLFGMLKYTRVLMTKAVNF